MKTFTYQDSLLLIATSLLSGTGCAVVTSSPTPGDEAPPAEVMDSPDPGDPVQGTGGAAMNPSPSPEPTEPAATGGGGGTTLPPTPPSTSCSGTATAGDVLLSDDFEAGSSNWFTNEEIFWSLVDDESQAFEQSYAADELMVAAGGCSDWSNVLVEARVKMLSGSDSDDMVAVFARLTDASNFYYVALHGDGTLKLRKRVGGSNSSIGTTYSDTTLSMNVWYRLGIETVGPQINMYLDGELVDRVDDPGKFSATDTDLSSGLAGFGTLGNATAVFDDVVVTQR